ncbi:MAG: S41 family peptidase [Planctomycetota bacterium]|nr:S41 family peptidase [Planctomycetota bacterium]
MLNFRRIHRFWLIGLVIPVCLAGAPVPGLTQQGKKPGLDRPAAGASSGSGKESTAEVEARRMVSELEARIKKQKEELELLKLFASSLAEIERSYVEKVDRRRLIEAAIDGMLSDLDRYSDYIPPQELSAFQTDIESRYGGIGIRVVKKPKDEFLTIITPILGSPSYEAGIPADSWMVRIDEKEAAGITVKQAIEKIKGEIGSEVRITTRDKQNGEEREFRVRRAIVQVRTVLGDQRLATDEWDYFLRDRPGLAGEKIGYVRLNSFGRQTSRELRTALDWLQEGGMRGLILDLRFNPGGLLSAAIEVADLFVDRGLIVRTEGRNAQPKKWMAKRTGTLTGFPMVVLVNDRSASASEIVAACLKDSGRAPVVGERSFGKGSVQNIIQLEKGKSVMKLTTASYYRPNGKNINRLPQHTGKDDWGVRPSPGYEVVMDDTEQREYFLFRQERDVIRKKEAVDPKEKFRDRQLDKAVEFILQKVKK